MEWILKQQRSKEDIMVKGSTQQEELTILDVYTPNIGYIRLVRDLDSDTVVVGDFNVNIRQINETEN